MRHWWGILVVLAVARPAPAQLFDRIALERADRKVAGSIVDFSHNHGADRRVYSPILGQKRDLYVYLPPGYCPARAYPLVIYLHMSYVDEHALLGFRQLQELDGMILRGEVPPMVVACPDGNIHGENRFREPHSFYVDGVAGRFGDHVAEEVLPFLLLRFSIQPGREAHGLLGTSAGGFGAMSMAIRRRDLFGAVASVAGPLNLRYSNVDDEYREDFDPATYRWRTRYDPDELVGVFYFGLSRVRARKYIAPVFGEPPGVEDRISRVNPADLLTSTDLRPNELAIYVNYAGRDNWNFDAQAESFRWLAAQRGVAMTVEVDPKARHSVPYFRRNLPRAYQWLGHHLPPPVDRAGSPAP